MEMMKINKKVDKKIQLKILHNRERVKTKQNTIEFKKKKKIFHKIAKAEYKQKSNTKM